MFAYRDDEITTNQNRDAQGCSNDKRNKTVKKKNNNLDYQYFLCHLRCQNIVKSHLFYNAHQASPDLPNDRQFPRELRTVPPQYKATVPEHGG